MEIHQIKYFLAVSRNRSFTKAALECNVSQPSLSAQIRKLEDELGGPLFERGRTGARLTERGEALRPRANEIVEQLERITAETAELDGLTRGTVGLGCLPTTGAHLLPDLLGAFGRAYPGIRVTLREESSPGLARALEHFEIDLAILDEAGMRPGLEGDALFSEPLYIAVSPGHRLAGRTEADLAELADEPVVLMKSGHGFNTIVRRALAGAGIEPKVVYESAEIETVQGLVGAGLGVSLVPRMVMKPAGIAYVAIAGSAVTRTLIVAYRSASGLGPAPRAMRAMIIEKLGNGSGRNRPGTRSQSAK